MRHFDYSFLKNNISSDVLGLSNVITDLKCREEIRKLQYGQAFESLRKKAIIESVKGSNAIEGIITSDSRIKDIVAGAKPQTHDELEIAGYKEALNLIFTEKYLDISEDTIKLFHAKIHEQTNPAAAGLYKENNNFIMEYYADGTRRIRFKPVEAKDVPKEMEQLLLAFYTARQDGEIPQLLLIPCFILDFLCIHPFTDGNGRVSRLLTVMLLNSDGYDIVKYSSLEGQINKYKESYYEALKASSENWHEETNDYVPFVINFLQILYRCFKDLDESFMELSVKKTKKSERVENILLNAIVPISKQDIANKLPDISIQTIELVLSKMLKEKTIEKIGTYKNARYVRKRL